VKTASERFLEATQVSTEKAIGVDASLLDFMESLNIPAGVLEQRMGMEGWGLEAFQQCEMLVLARKLNHKVVIEYVSKTIGTILAAELARGNYSAPRIVSEGLLNLQNHKPFKIQSGRKSSGDHLLVLMALHYLKTSGVEKPSQSEVANLLAESGKIIKRPHLSKIFDELGLKAHSSKASEAASAAGKRKRGKP
jgi:hypothetical protein